MWVWVCAWLPKLNNSGVDRHSNHSVQTIWLLLTCTYAHSDNTKQLSTWYIIHLDDWRFHNQDSPISFNFCFLVHLSHSRVHAHRNCKHINDYDDKVYIWLAHTTFFMKEKKIRNAKESRGVNGAYVVSKCNHTYMGMCIQIFRLSFHSSPILSFFLRHVRFRRAVLSHP